MIYWLRLASVSLSLFPFKFSHPSDLLFHPLIQIMLHSPCFKATTMARFFLPLAWHNSIFLHTEAQRHCKWLQGSLLLINVSRPHIYKGPAELHCPLQVVPEEVIGTTHGSRDCSVWERGTLRRDKSQHCTGRSPLPRGWAGLAVWMWLKTRTVGDAGWGGLPAVKDYCTYILWRTFCANCYLVGATQSVTKCGCVCAPIRVPARHGFVLGLLL